MLFFRLISPGSFESQTTSATLESDAASPGSGEVYIEGTLTLGLQDECIGSDYEELFVLTHGPLCSFSPIVKPSMILFYRLLMGLWHLSFPVMIQRVLNWASKLDIFSSKVVSFWKFQN